MITRSFTFPPASRTTLLKLSFFQNLAPLDKLTQVFTYLDMPFITRAQLITAYIPNIDQAGRCSGPNSTDVEDAISLADELIGGVQRDLKERNLTEIVNAIVVSDHGSLISLPGWLVRLVTTVD